MYNMLGVLLLCRSLPVTHTQTNGITLIIYKIYIYGETVQKLNERFGWHNTCFLYPDKYGFCRVLSSHFNQGCCKNADYVVQILEKLAGNGRTARGAIDPKQTAERKKRETEWMLKLRTVYPYGLNDRIGDEYKHTESHSLVGNKFPQLSRTHPRESRGKSRIGFNTLEPDTFFR